jgi:thymidylate kinase
MTAATPHPLLLELAGAWRRRGVEWTLLRMPSDPAAPTGDVDVLVAEADWPALREAALETGFVALPGWDSPRNLILVRYDQASDRWLVLDVVTALGFRRAPAWESPALARMVLDGRRGAGGLVTPADGDAFWLLLLHCLLDKAEVDERYRESLVALAASAGDSELGERVLREAGSRRSTVEFTAALAAGRWAWLAAVARELVRGLRRRTGVRARAACMARGVASRVRRPLLLPRRRGVSVALLGPNGVGKSTLAAGLCASFPFEARVVYMGIWKHAGGGPLRQVAELAARPFRLWLAYASAQRHVLLGRLVVFDRYVHEAALPAEPPLRWLKSAYFWLLRHAVPGAQRTVVVDVPGEVAYERKQENPPDELERERLFYAGLAPRLRGAVVVDASRPAEAVRSDVADLVWGDLARRWGAPPPRDELAAAAPQETATPVEAR